MEKFVSLEARKHKFEIETVINGEKIKGKFECHYPSIRDTLDIDIMTSQMLEGANPQTLPNRAIQTATMMAHFEVLLDKTPEWFDLNNVTDEELLLEVFTEMATFQQRFREGNEDDRLSEHSNEGDNVKPMEGK